MSLLTTDAGVHISLPASPVPLAEGEETVVAAAGFVQVCSRLNYAWPGHGGKAITATAA
jgi:hypothetical protein